MTQILNVVYVAAMVVFLFGAAVFVHEFGHFWMARRRGLKVEGFAIGFGPKIFGWTKDGVEYAWRLIPAGGFVKLPQMITAESLEGSADTAEPLPPISPLSKILVAVAGPIMNVVFAFAIATLIYFVGLPVPVSPPIIGYVEPGSPEAKLGILEGDKIVKVGDKAIKSWEDVMEATILSRTNVLPVAIERAGVVTTYSLTATVSDAIGLKVLNLDPRDHPVIKGFLAESAAQAAGLKEEDEVVSFGKIPVAGREQLVSLIQERANSPTEIIVKRGGHKVTLTVTPKLNPTTKKGFIGAQIGGSDKIIYSIQRPGPTPWALVGEVLDKTVKTFSALFHSKQTGVGAKDLSGPVGILAMLAAEVNTDFRLALRFLVLLNINLAVLNLLPLPVLDGGHICMAILERIRGRALSVKFVEYVTTVFAVLLISFMVYVSFYDIKRIPLFKSMFHREMQIEQPETSPQTPAAVPVKP
jgi:regulator of sigma E protease